MFMNYPKFNSMPWWRPNNIIIVKLSGSRKLKFKCRAQASEIAEGYDKTME